MLHAQLQMEDEALLVVDGRVRHALRLSMSVGVVPRLSGVCPIAVLSGEEPTEIHISGSGLGAEGVTLSSRMQGASATPWNQLVRSRWLPPPPPPGRRQKLCA